jgi:cytochrome c-type biogenesis protein CcmH
MTGMRALLVVIGPVALVACVALGIAWLSSGLPAAPPSAKALESTLLAPCCFGGTIDVHDSDISRELRAEIEARVGRGESTAAIEADLVGRYGAQMRAMPDRAAFLITSTLSMIAIALAGGAVLALARRWEREGERSEGRTCVPGCR